MKKKGFTLIELIITICIIGVLGILSAVIYRGINEENREKLNAAEIKLIEAAAVKYGEAHKKEVQDGNISISYDKTNKSFEKNVISSNDDVAATSNINVAALKYLGYYVDASDNENDINENNISDTDNVYMFIENNRVKAKYGNDIFNFSFKYDKDKNVLKINVNENDNDENNNTKKYQVFINNDSLYEKEQDFTGNSIETKKLETNILSPTYIATVKITIGDISLTKSKKINLDNDLEFDASCLSFKKIFEDGNEEDYDFKWSKDTVRLYNKCATSWFYDNGEEFTPESYIDFTDTGKHDVNLTSNNIKYNATVLIDKSAPDIKYTKYVSDENDPNALEENEFAINKTGNLVNDWHNKINYPSGIALNFNIKDLNSTIDEIVFEKNSLNNYDDVLINDYTDSWSIRSYKSLSDVSFYKRIKENGKRKVKITAVDKVGNTKEEIIDLNVDRTDPVCNPDFTDEIVDPNCKDDESGIDKILYKTENESDYKEASSTFKYDTSNIKSKTILYFKAIDKAGNESYEKKITIDKGNNPGSGDENLVCPKITSTIDQEKWTKDKITFTFDFSNTNAESYDWYTNDTDDVGNFKGWGNNSLKDSNNLSKTISGEGKRKIKLLIYYKDGKKKECTNDNKVYYIDKSAPTVPTVKGYKWKSNNETDRPTSSSGLSGYTFNTWSNKKIYTEALKSKDDLSGVDHYEYTTTGATTDVKNYKGNGRNIEAAGTSTIKYRACDKVGNCSDYSKVYTAKVDKTAPTVPTVKGYKWKSNNIRPTSSSGLFGYTFNTWSNKKIYTEASKSKDDLSGVDHYEYTTTGATTDVKNYKGNGRNIEAAGTSTIKYRACDKVGNCSDYSNVYTAKIDVKKPSCSPTVKYSTTSATIDPNCTDSEGSGLKYIEVNVGKGSAAWYGLKDNDHTQNKWHERNSSYIFSTEAEGQSTVYFRATDKAGNVSDQKKVTVINKLQKISTYDDVYCTMHNGVATASGGSTTVDCSHEVKKSNCRTSYNRNDHGNRTYANMQIKLITSKVKGKDLNVTLSIEIRNGYFGTNLSGNKRYLCLKNGNRTFTNSNCTSNTVTVTSKWGGNKVHTITETFTIKNFKDNSGSYSLKMWGPYKASCMDKSNVNNVNMIYSFQTGYIFKI